jgi:hypothetical protein
MVYMKRMHAWFWSHNEKIAHIAWFFNARRTGALHWRLAGGALSVSTSFLWLYFDALGINNL